MNSKLPHNHVDTRQERREEKLRKKREHIAQHGKSIGKIYKDAVEKRAGKQV
ncbi:MAG: hypothetical protein Q7J73_07400 [Dehalococcoidales bacterium]|nr:hypothetical protein [Dehalococcoidales bacterium]